MVQTKGQRGSGMPGREDGNTLDSSPLLYVMNTWAVDYYIRYFGGVKSMATLARLIFSDSSFRYFIEKLREADLSAPAHEITVTAYH